MFTKSTYAAWALERRLDPAIPVVAQVLDAIRDPVHVLLDRHDHVREHRWASRPGDGEEVREPDRTQAEVRTRSLGSTRRAATDRRDLADVDAQQRAGHRVESRCEHDGVELELTRSLTRRPCAVDLLDGRLRLHVDQLDVRPVVRVEVSRIYAQALAPDHGVRREYDPRTPPDPSRPHGSWRVRTRRQCRSRSGRRGGR